MTSRTTDFHCPRCRKYLFSEYTYPMGKAERQKLDEQAATYCPCPPAHTPIPVNEVLANSRAHAEAAGVIYGAQLDAGGGSEVTMEAMPLSSKEKQEAFRARIKEQGLSEVRGIFLPPEKHAKLKEMAARLNKPTKKPKDPT